MSFRTNPQNFCLLVLDTAVVQSVVGKSSVLRFNPKKTLFIFLFEPQCK